MKNEAMNWTENEGGLHGRVWRKGREARNIIRTQS